jgi:hypothetical protein
MDPRLEQLVVNLSLPAFLTLLHLCGRLLPARPPSVWRSFWSLWCKLTRKPFRTALALAALPAVASLLFAIRMGPPVPYVHDEFSYLLAGETFASGRLTNPTHPMWVHFESFHILQRPTYMSMYPPVQGLILAAGILMGHAWYGVVLSSVLANILVWWAARQWLPARWALLAGLLAAILFTGTRWSVGYYGGSMTALAGALVVGSAGILRRRPSTFALVLYAAGIVLCANSRPFEGFVLVLLVSSWLLFGWLKLDRSSRLAYVRASLPAVLLLTAGVASTLAYNRAVTGNPLRLPYEEAYRQYFSTGRLLVESPTEAPVYRHDVMRRFYQHLNRVAWNPATRFYYSLVSFEAFYLGRVLFVLFPLALFALGPSTARPLLLLAFAGAATMAFIPVFLPHYFAGFAVAFLVACVHSVRWLASRSVAGRRRGWLFLCVVLLLVAWGIGGRFHAVLYKDWSTQRAFALRRASIERQLLATPGEHLVIVRYGANHPTGQEWVYNHANIDSSRIVWARGMDPANDRAVRCYFAARHAWIVDGDAIPAKLTHFVDSAGPAPAPASP